MGSTVPLNRIGDMHQAEGDNNAALNAYQQALAIRQQLADSDPNIVEWQTDLVASYYRLADLQPEQANTYMRQSLTILKKLQQEGKLSHYWEQWVDITEERLLE